MFLLASSVSPALDQDVSVDQVGSIEHGDPVDSPLIGQLDGVENEINDDVVVENASQSSSGNVDDPGQTDNGRSSGDEPGDVSSIADNDGNAGNYCIFLNSMFVSNVIITMV